MSEIEEILADVRKRRPVGTRAGSRIALVFAGAGVVAALAAGTALGISATASISRQGLGSQESAVAVYESTEEPATTVSGSVPSEEELSALGPADAAPAEGAPEEATPSETVAPVEPPVYGALTDPDTIPRPPASWSADELANAEVWLEQQSIIADCMLQTGFEYEFSPWWTWPANYRPGSDHAEVQHDMEEEIALYGKPDQGLGDDYDWREAGCVGYAVHVTGMDNAN